MAADGTPLEELLGRLTPPASVPACVLVSVHATEGSVPRNAGAWMALWPDGHLTGTVGGGQLEFEGLAWARGWLAEPTRPPEVRRFPLGPSLGQCCGGVVYLRAEAVQVDGPQDTEALARRLSAHHLPVALFGGGHVGRALARALAPLPFALRWIDSRDEVFPPDLPARVHTEHSDPVHAAVPHLPPGSHVLVMSFSHAEDLDIIDACLQRQARHHDLPLVGLIGSRTKWASFRQRLLARGHTEEALQGITSPIGLPGIAGKEPEVIAASVAAQLLLATNTLRQAGTANPI